MNTRALQYLERDVLRNIVAFKMLTTHDDRRCVYISSEFGEAVMVLLEPQVFAYDRAHYPDADSICVISSDHPSLTNQLLSQLEQDQKVVFKLNSDADALEVQKQFRIQRVTSFLSYTDIKPNFPDKYVQISTRPSAQMFEWLATEGHTRDWLEPLFAANHAFCCELFNAKEQLESVCFAFENHKTIWEIGGVFTPEALRGRGLASRVVQTAIAELQQREKRIRYQVWEQNQASIRLAQHLKLELFLTITHFMTYGV